MSTEHNSDHKIPLIDWQSWWNRLIEPPAFIQDRDERYRVRLSVGVQLLSVVVSIIIVVSFEVSTNGYFFASTLGRIFAVALLISCLAYLLSRTRFYPLGSIIIVINSISFTLIATIINPLNRPHPVDILYYMVFPVILTNILLKPKYRWPMDLISLLSILIFEQITHLAGWQELVQGPFFFILFFVMLTQLVNRHRDQIETDYQKELTESEQRYRFLFEHGPQPMMIVEGADSRFTEVNETAIKQYGYSREEFLEMTVYDLHGPNNRPARFDELAGEGDPNRRTTTTQHRKQDGTVIDVEVIIYKMTYQGRLARLVQASDITERVEAEAERQHLFSELAKRNRRLEMLYQVGQLMNASLEVEEILTGLVDEAMRVTRASHGLVLVVNETTNNFERRALRGFTPEETQQAHRMVLTLGSGLNGQAYQKQQIIRIDQVSHEPNYFPLLPQTKSELVVPIIQEERVIGNLDLQSPQPAGFRQTDLDYLKALADQVAIALTNARLYGQVQQELIERKRTEAKLQDAEAKYRHLVEQLPAITYIVTYGAVNRTTYISPKVYSLLGFTPDEWTSSPDLWINQIHPDDRDWVVEQVKLADTQQKPLNLEYRILSRDDRTMWFQNRFILIFDEQGKLQQAQGLMFDITDLKETQAELEKAKEAAESANQAKSQFLANMSHEIRTPMNGVIGMTAILMETSLTPEQIDYVETIRHSGLELLNIINSILDFSKIESGRIWLEQIPFQLEECIEGVLDLLNPKALEKGLNLAYLLHEKTPTSLIGDPTRLRQILVNLMGNGIKFTDEGEIVVEVEPETIETDRVKLHFAVRDTGIGIPAEQMDQLFKSFSQVDASITRQYGGTGLGLAISKELTRLMDGDIWVESKSQKGSAFHFTIWVPFSAEQLSISESNESLLVNKRLLVAAKNDTNRRILTRYAQTWGMYSRHTPSGQEALTWLQQKEAFDVIIINNELTEMSGLSLAEQIRQTLPHLKSSLIYLNKFGQQFEADMMAGHGFAAVLTKPIKPSQFFNTLMTLFNESHETAPSLPSTRLAKPLEKTIPLRILLAEDNLVNQKVALKTLKHLGYQADVVGNGLAVLEALSHTQYDLILMDIQMPEMDGLTATRQLRATQPNKQCPWIIAMTANAMEGDRDKCLAAGMNDYLTKPIQMDQLIEALLVAASQRKKASADPY